MRTQFRESGAPAGFPFLLFVERKNTLPPGFPRAGNTLLVASSPLIVAGIQINGTTVVPVGAASLSGDGGNGANLVAGGLFLFNGSTWDRIRNNSAGNISAVTQPFAEMVSNPGEWTIDAAPAGNIQGTVTKAAGGAGVRHVLKSLFFVLYNNAAVSATPGIYVRDGASGAGTIIYVGALAIPAVSGSMAKVALAGLNIVGSPNTAMTLEFSAAGGANTFEVVSGSGYSTI